ncbi:MAG: hypothetical protein P1P65_03875 [Treponema sp.]
MNAIGEKIDTIFEDGNTASAWLGLARKEGDDKLYLIVRDIKAADGTELDITNFIIDRFKLQEDCEKETRELTNFTQIDFEMEGTGPESNDLYFGSIRDALEWRWKNLKKGFPDSLSSNPFFFSSESYPWLIFNTNVDNDGVSIKTFRFTRVVLCFAAKTDVADPEVYFLNADGLSRAVDWTITFIKGGEIYSFRVGPYSIKQGNGPPYPYPPVIDDMLNPPYPEGLTIKKHYDKNVYHMFRLSSLVRLSLEKQLMDNGISADVAKDKAKAYLGDFEPFKNDFANLKTWEVYLTIGEIKNPNNGMYPLFAWRNTFKLVGADASDFWSKCWE